MPALKRVGHKGADLLAPGNTRASFDAALAAGVDMIEFDILPERWEDGASELYLAHDYADLGRRRETALTLAEGLDHLAGPTFAGIELDVDVKGPGYERAVLEALRERGLLERSLISTQYVDSLVALRTIEPDARLGWSVPKLRNDPFRNPALRVPAIGVMLAYRRALPGRAARALRAGRCDALMAQWRLITPGLVRTVSRAGGELYAWTVDEAPRIAAIERMGVTGVITNDPRLFSASRSRT